MISSSLGDDIAEMVYSSSRFGNIDTTREISSVFKLGEIFKKFNHVSFNYEYIYVIRKYTTKYSCNIYLNETSIIILSIFLKSFLIYI